MTTYDDLVIVVAKAVINAKTNGLCGDTWPGPCDGCDCGLEGMTLVEAAGGWSAKQERREAADVVDSILLRVAGELAAMEAQAERSAKGFSGAGMPFAASVTYEQARGIHFSARLVRGLMEGADRAK